VAGNLYEEEANEETSHYNLIVAMGKAIGLTKEEVDNAVPSPTMQVAFLAWETLTKSRPWQEGLAAKMILERMNDKNLVNASAVESERWKRQLGISSQDVDFFNIHAEVDQIHGGETLTILEEHATTPEQQQAVVEAARLSLHVWTIFFEGIANEALAES